MKATIRPSADSAGAVAESAKSVSWMYSDGRVTSGRG
jgi:hypothetical protein